MNVKEQSDYLYLVKDDYDSEQKINGEAVKAYSPKKLKELYPNGDYKISGETWERKKRDKDKDIGKIELNDKILYVSPPGKHKRLLRKEASFLALQDGSYLALLKVRLLPFVVIAAVIAAIVCFALFYRPSQKVADNITPVESGLKIYGDIDKENQPFEGATVSAQQAGTEIYSGSSDENGYYEITPVASGRYSAVATCGESILTKPAEVLGKDAEVDFHFPKNIVKALLVLKAEDGGEVPNITVAGLAEEAVARSEATQAQELDLTLTATRRDESKIDETDKNAVEEISGDLELTWFDFSLEQEILENGKQLSTENLTQSGRVFEIAIPYDSTNAVGTYVFVCSDHTAQRLTVIKERPTEDFTDGTYFVDTDTVYLYADRMTLYAVGSTDAGGQTMGSDMIVYSDGATVNLKSRTVTMYYCHDENSTNSARVELYLKGKDEDVLIAQSGIVPPGSELSSMTLTAKTSILPQSDSYEGTMRIVYLGTDGEVATNVEIPVTITFE